MQSTKGSHQLALGSELLRAQILDTYGSDQCYHLSALNITHSPASSSSCSAYIMATREQPMIEANA